MYDVLDATYNKLYGDEQLNKLEIIAAHLALTPETTLLDVGCGTGLSSFLPCKITGIEPSTVLLKQCPFPVVQGTAENLPFAHHSFDVVICVTVLHCTNIPKALAEIKRVACQQVVLSILHQHRAEIEKQIKKYFSIEKVIQERHDTIYFCKP